MTNLSLDLLKEFVENYPHNDAAIIGKVGRESEVLPEHVEYDLPVDICAGPLPRNHKTIVCMDVLEHVLDPVRAGEHLSASLLPGGYIFVTAPYVWQYHEYPIDTYRYTETALKYIFRELEVEKCWKIPDSTGGCDGEIRVNLIASKPLKNS